MAVHLQILGSGDNQKERDEHKGKLFERMMGELLRRMRYRIDHLDRRLNGMEIDIDGCLEIEQVPFMAECKAEKRAIDSPVLQKFLGKYFLQHRRTSEVRGLFFTLSALNTTARELFDQEIVDDPELSKKVLLFEEDRVAKLLIGHWSLPEPETIRHLVSARFNLECGETKLLYLDLGFLWAQVLLGKDETVPEFIVLLNQHGELVDSDLLSRQVLDLSPEIRGYKCLNLDQHPPKSIGTAGSSVVRVGMSSSWFDYRFPAAPKYFIGRKAELEAALDHLQQVQENQTTSRGLVISGHSGIGKSSFVLKLQQELADRGITMLAIDSRLCDDVTFLFHAVNELLADLRAAPEMRQALADVRVHGLDSLIDTLGQIHQALQTRKSIAVLFFDQFESVYLEPDLARMVANVFLQVTEQRLHIVFGFAWKTDLISLVEGFPWQERNLIKESARSLELRQFAVGEVAEILRELERQWGERLHDGLKRRLTEFSRGLPWLLKKVCAHTLSQREKGFTQEDLMVADLNLSDLFEEDLAGLNSEEKALIRRIAQRLPATFAELNDWFELSNIEEALRNFVDQRILIQITDDISGSYGNVKYDVYSDIFRDYLVTGRIPVDEPYYFFSYPPGVFKFLSKIRERGQVTVLDEVRESGWKAGSVYNLTRDLRNLGLVHLNEKVLTVNPDIAGFEDEQLARFLQGKMKQNKSVSVILARLADNGRLTLDQVVDLLRGLFPSLVAKDETWRHYARVMGSWLSHAKLALYEDGEFHHVPREELFEKLVLGRAVFSSYQFPVCFKDQVLDCVVYVGSRETVTSHDLAEFFDRSPQTIQKMVSDCLNLGLLERCAGRTFGLTAVGGALALASPEQSAIIFGQQALRWDIFAEFIDGIRGAGYDGADKVDVVSDLLQRRNVVWRQLTKDKLAMILTNWAEYAGLLNRVGNRLVTPENNPQLSLFSTVME